ncbi:SH3 domain-containing protein [Secundilactobacillus hailunensis]|uniref:SH3 domain-containing protein n=1 Tax=Secundilactobacillus hailunensis TaxID=2559923 RepID=A0ABW1T6T2_9LACO|nr:SH3 domain-containing protein [Secundilactobacillus hailunensis]
MPIDVSNTPDMYTINANGTFTFNAQAGVRNEPNIDTTPIVYYESGESVNYSKKLKNGNWLWLSYESASGTTRYAPYANTDTGEYLGTDSNASVQPIVPPTGTETGQTGELGSLTGQAGADVANQTPDGTTLTESGQFTFSEPVAGRASTDMDAEHLDSWSIGETVDYNAKIKADGHYWFQYVNTNGLTYYVPYVTISPFRYYGTDTNPGDPVIPQKTTTGGGETEITRSHNGTDTPMPAMTSDPNREPAGEGVTYPTVATLTITSDAWGRDKAYMNSHGVQNIRLYKKGTPINYTGKVFNDGHLWVVLRNGQFLPVSTYVNVESIHRSGKSGAAKDESDYSYVINDRGKIQPISEYWPYTTDTDDTRRDTRPWEVGTSITDIDTTTAVQPTTDELAAMQKMSDLIDQEAASDCVTIAYTTDTHVDSYKTPSTARVLRNMQLMSYYAANFGVDLVVHGGDLNDGVKPKNFSVADVKRAMDAIKLSHRPFIVLQGNHDDNSGYARDETLDNADQVITNNEAAPLRLDQFSQWLNVPSVNDEIEGIKTNPYNAVFGRYDVPDSNVTVLVLDGFDMADNPNPNREAYRHGHTDYSAGQQKWLNKTLGEISADRKIVVFDHIALNGIGSAWNYNADVDGLFENSTTTSYKPGVTASGNIYTSLVNHQSTYHNILGFFAGHTHCDNYATSGGIEFVTTLAGVADRALDVDRFDNAKTTQFRLGDIEENGWGVIQLNPTAGQVIQHRFGETDTPDNGGTSNVSGTHFLPSWEIDNLPQNTGGKA